MVAASSVPRFPFALPSWEHLPLRMRAEIPLDDSELFELCAANHDLRIERTADGELVIMPPTGGETGHKNAQLTGQLVAWSNVDGTGVAFDSSTGFILPDGAMRAPDASWVTLTRWNALAAEQRAVFPLLCPDFVAELRSPTDKLADLQSKLEEYLACGARLGWLIDPESRRAHVYRPQREVEILDAPATLSGEPVLRSFVLDLGRVW